MRADHMKSANLDLLAILNPTLEYTVQNFWTEKLLIQLGLDSTNVTFEAIFNRLIDFSLANINSANTLALIGAAFYVATLMVRTIIPIRVLGIISIVFLIGYGVLAGALATLLLYLLSLPVNVIRLRQMLKLVKKAKVAAQGDLSMDWLRPFMIPRKYKSGDVLFNKGDVAQEMFLTVTGKFLVTEIDIELSHGCIMGELGFIAPENRRTQTVKCIEDGEVLTITYDKLLELYFQNPEFGYYFLRLTGERLVQNVTRLEGVIEENKIKHRTEVAANGLSA